MVEGQDAEPLEEQAAAEAIIRQASEPTPAGEDAENTTINDTVWRRLKTIFQRHQQRETEPSAGVEDTAALDEETSPEKGTTTAVTTPPETEEPQALITSEAQPETDPTAASMPATPAVTSPTGEAPTGQSPARATPSATAQIQRQVIPPPKAESSPDSVIDTRQAKPPVADTTPEDQPRPSVADAEHRDAIKETPNIPRVQPIQVPVPPQTPGEPALMTPSTEPAVAGPPAPQPSIAPSLETRDQLPEQDETVTPPPSQRGSPRTMETPGETEPVAASSPDAKPVPVSPDDQPPRGEAALLRETAPLHEVTPLHAVTQPLTLETQVEQESHPTPATRTLDQPFAQRQGAQRQGAQPRPLQDVWRVERLDQARPERRSHHPLAPSPAGTAAAPAVQAATAQTGTIQRHLKNVAAGRPSRSSIEVISPRRPRPSIPPQQAPTPVPPDVQVETEIGPLPAELWTLIGEPVPSREAISPGEAEAEPAIAQQRGIQRQRDASTSTAPHSETERLGPVPGTSARYSRTEDSTRPQTQALPTLTTAQPAAPETQIAPKQAHGADTGPGSSADSGTPTLIQRVPAPAAPEATSAVAPAGEESVSRPVAETQREPDQAGPAQDESVDVDALAQRVYKDLKRRLAVEWERAWRR